MRLLALFRAPVSLPSRDRRLDLLRGFCVVVMIFDHFGWRELTTHFRIGLVTLAEFFFLVSGATLGVVAARIVEPGRERRLERRLLKRAMWLWAVHLVSVAAYKALEGPLFPPREMRRFWRGVEPLWTWLSFDQPSVLNVLPRYALFLALAPFAVELVRRGRHRTLLALSAGLWLTNFATGGALALPGFEQPRAPYPSASWQFLFFGGLAVSHLRSVGSHRARGSRSARALLVASCALVALAIVVPRTELWNQIPGEWVSRSLLGPLRLLNLGAAALLATAFAARFREPLWNSVGWLLEPYGRNALPAFILHIPLVWMLLVVPGVGHDDDLRKPVAAALLLLLLPIVRGRAVRRWLAP